MCHCVSVSVHVHVHLYHFFAFCLNLNLILHCTKYKGPSTVNSSLLQLSASPANIYQVKVSYWAVAGADFMWGDSECVLNNSLL